MTFKKIAIAIPARISSSRLPRKVLEKIDGIPILSLVLEKCKIAIPIESIFVCTDSEEIRKIVSHQGFRVFMTSENCSSGSHRISSVINTLLSKIWDCDFTSLKDDEKQKKMNETLIINVQADQPFLNPVIIKNMIYEAQKDKEVFDVITPIYKLNNTKIHDQNVVKVLLNYNNKVLYFSRSAIPFLRDCEKKDWGKNFIYWGHVGIYGYKATILKNWNLMKNSLLEKAEKLEQLRLIENGCIFKTYVVEGDSLSIDTYEQLEEAREFSKKLNLYP